MGLVTRRQIEVRQGSEGPSYDPYGFIEIVCHLTIDQKKCRVVNHSGLGNWLEVNGERIDTEFPEEAFELIVGMSPKAVAAAHSRRQHRCPKCCSRQIESAEGYPGETLYICVKCGTIIGCDFSLSAII